MAIEFFADKAELNPEAVARKRLAEAVRAHAEVKQGTLHRPEAYDRHAAWLIQTLDETLGELSTAKAQVSRLSKSCDRFRQFNQELLNRTTQTQIGFSGFFDALKFALHHRKIQRQMIEESSDGH